MHSRHEACSRQPWDGTRPGRAFLSFAGLSGFDATDSSCGAKSGCSPDGENGVGSYAILATRPRDTPRGQLSTTKRWFCKQPTNFCAPRCEPCVSLAPTPRRQLIRPVHFERSSTDAGRCGCKDRRRQSPDCKESSRLNPRRRRHALSPVQLRLPGPIHRR